MRIRYTKKDGNGCFYSVKKITHATNGARYHVKLDVPNNQWLVLDDGSGLIAASGSQTNVTLMKKEAKEALVQLGIEFETESRKGKVKELKQAS